MSYVPVSTLDDGMPSHHYHPSGYSIRSSEAQQNLTQSLNQHQASTTIFTSAFGHIPEASQLQWMDDFYQGKPGIVAVFDRDGYMAGNFQFWHFVRITSLLVMLAILYYFMGVWVAKTQNDEDLVILDDVQSFYFLLIAGLFIAMAYRADLQQRQQHVAITTEGIRIDQGMAMTIIIPFETIHSCEAHMTTKYFCGYMERPDLTQIHVVRSLAPMEQIGFRKTRSFVIYGLVRPQEFVALVEAFKNSQQHGTYEGGTELMSSNIIYPNHHHSSPTQMPSQMLSPQLVTSQQMMQPQRVQPLRPYSQQSQIIQGDDTIVTSI